MNKLLWLLDAAWSERLGWTIVHSFWQIATVTATYAGAALWLRRSAANVRYLLGCLALVAMLCLPFATFALLDNTQTSIAAVDATRDLLPAHDSAESTARLSPSPHSAPGDSPLVLEQREARRNAAHPDQESPVETVAATWAVRIGPFLPWISTGWLLGIVVFSVRPLLGLLIVSRLRSRGLSPPSAKLSQLAEEMIGRLHMRPTVQFAESALIQVPTVLGYLRPMVLLPASALTGLSAEQLELLLAHELAHVRRHDYLVNGLQTGIETILFYHPGTWWVSAQVRMERENCCDDVAVGLCGNRGTYVEALVAMELQRVATPLVLAASGGSLVKRARRLISPTVPETGLQRASLWLAGLLPMGAVAILLLLGSTFAVSGGARETEPRVERPASAAQPERPATPAAAADEQANLPPPTAEATASDLALTVTLEDDARKALKIVLRNLYARPIKTWEDIAPGKIQLQLPELESDRYLLDVSADGYATRHLEVIVSKEGISTNAKTVELFRQRYAVLHYVVNTQGERQLTGPNVTEGRVAISYGSVPDLHGDWMIRQDGKTPKFSPHRFQAGNGFTHPAVGAKFEDIDLAPQPDQYNAGFIAADKGTVLLTHIIGDGPRWRRYAKILVEDITETPPPGIQVIDKLLPPTIPSKPPVAKTAEPVSDRSSGEVIATFSLEDDARVPVTLELHDNSRKTLKTWKTAGLSELRLTLPELDHERYSLTASAEGYSPVRTELRVSASGVEPSAVRFELFRLRYLVLRYAINTKGARNLNGENVQDGRVAVLFGSLSDLRDWSVGQRNGQMRVIVHRALQNTGFAVAAEGASFDKLTTAPPTDDYSPTEFEFKKGMVLFNRVVGHQPETARYAKLMVEDITEERPKDLVVIDSRPK